MVFDYGYRFAFSYELVCSVGRSGAIGAPGAGPDLQDDHVPGNRLCPGLNHQKGQTCDKQKSFHGCGFWFFEVSEQGGTNLLIFVKQQMDGMYYSGQEIFTIAVRIEENGYAFYSAAATALQSDTDIRRLFLDLAEKEVLHIAVFQKLMEKFEAEQFTFNLEESADYIAHLADQHIFGKPGAGTGLAKTIQSPREALEIAYRFENDSVAFYTELEKRTETDARKLIRQIIREEQEHAEEIREFM
jgi:rubrerythrin